MFEALLIEGKEDYRCELVQLDESDLPAAPVQLKVLHSTLNYKDALAITGAAPVVRQFPMVPGIDLVGEVLEDTSAKFSVGERVVVNGYGLGETHWGGLAQRAAIPSEHLLLLPDAFTSAQAMAIGTAGYTAMLSVMRLQELGVTPDAGPILVTGAAGGVGSIAIILLSALGFDVIAATGRLEEGDYLQQLGASQLIDRRELNEPGKPLAKERWAGAIDCVGSHTLANVCAGTQYGGVVTCCGLAQGMDFPASVAPFILRGVTLAGIDSVQCAMARRQTAWDKLAATMDLQKLERVTQVYPLADSLELAAHLMQGKVRGRTVIDVNA